MSNPKSENILLQKPKAALLTGKSTGAIATIALKGPGSKKILTNVFKPRSPKTSLRPGTISLGTIYDNNKQIDEITIGTESPNEFAIHSHGNPLIAQSILQILARQGTEIITPDQFIFAGADTNSILAEARIALPQALTLAGTELLMNQPCSALHATLTNWQTQLTDQTLPKIQTHARQILQNSAPAKILIFGLNIVLAGPPNSGKSTLLNHFAGTPKALVSNIKGTTRDWVSCSARLGSLHANIFDTAGLDKSALHQLEAASQNATHQILQNAQIILLVLDSQQDIKQLDPDTLQSLPPVPRITVFNKCDLPPKLNINNLPVNLRPAIPISAATAQNTPKLTKVIIEQSRTQTLSPKTPVCFTQRQQRLMTELTAAQTSNSAANIIARLLTGKISV